MRTREVFLKKKKNEKRTTSQHLKTRSKKLEYSPSIRNKLNE